MSSPVAARTASSCLSASTTDAPACAKAVAVASPMPEPAPVISATLPFITVMVVSFLWAQERLDRAALVHGAVAFGHLVEGQGQVEDLAGVDPSLAHQIDQLGEVAAHGGRATVQMDVGVEQLRPLQL